MKLRRQARLSTRRQKLSADDLVPAPPSFAYRAKRSEAGRGTGRQTPHETPATAAGAARGRFWLQRLGLIILLLAVIVSAVNVLSLSADPKVLPLATSSSRSLLRPITDYEAAAARDLGSSIWNRNKITIDTASLNRQLLDQFPELSAVSVTIPLLAHRPLVYVQPAQPALILTADNNKGSFLIDTTGKALLRAATPAGFQQTNLPLLNDQSGLGIKTNRQVLPAASVSFIQTVMTQLAAKQVAVSGMTLPAAASELDVQIAGQPYFVKFNLQSDNPRREAGTFLAVINQLHRQNITPSQYVDVRVDGRAYYK
jgi:hypothetical protein